MKNFNKFLVLFLFISIIHAIYKCFILSSIFFENNSTILVTSIISSLISLFVTIAILYLIFYVMLLILNLIEDRISSVEYSKLTNNIL